VQQYPLSVFLFHRDLRLEDNTGLMAALRQSDAVIPCFVADPRQVEPHPYRSPNALQFMAESLLELSAALQRRGGRLFCTAGDPAVVLQKLCAVLPVSAIFANRDYTPFARERDDAIAAACARAGVPFRISGDALLVEPEEMHKDDGKPYTVFTPFFRKLEGMPVRVSMPVRARQRGRFFARPIPQWETDIRSVLRWNRNPHIAVHGGRSRGIAILRSIGDFRSYAADRDAIADNATTHLSAHLKFGTVSVREAHQAIVRHLGETHPLLRQLAWREFFTHIAFHFPHVFGHAFRRAYDRVTWSRSRAMFTAWCEGRTGFPIVDAGMRELVATGFMHNRARMVAASFLVKDLHVDWRWGERFFAQHLVDYDPAVNNGNWQWSASTGCDAQPYFRIFNPWLQQRRFDPVCAYVRRWVPELRGSPPERIHRLEREPIKGYVRPIADHAIESRVAIAAFHAAKSRG